MDKFEVFPWDKEGSKPYYVNEQGYEWWIDTSSTDYARSDTRPGHPLKAICFYVRKDGRALSRVLIDENTNDVLADEQNLEALAVKIDILRFHESDGDTFV